MFNKKKYLRKNIKILKIKIYENVKQAKKINKKAM